MSATTVVFVESNTSGTGALLCMRAVARGYRALLCARKPELYPWAPADGVDVATVDTSDEAALLALLDPLRERIAAVTTSSEYFVATAARLAAVFGRPSPPVDAVETCRDKGRLSAFLGENDVRTPATRIVGSTADVDRAVSALGLPLVVKPPTGSGSVSVRRVDTIDAARAAVAELLANRTNERGLPLPEQVLLQELVVGPEYSVEALGTTIVGVTSKHLGGPDGTFVEIGHDHPALGDPAEIAAVAETTRRALVALGFTVGATHAELRVGPSGPVVIEINPRLAGGFIPEIVRRALGVDLVDAVLSSALGAPVDLRPTEQRHASIRFVLPSVEGSLDGWVGLEEARALPDVVEVRTYRKPGDRIAVHGDFRDRIGHVIAVAGSGAEAAEAAEAAVRKVGVRSDVDTGRIRGAIADEARQILFGATIDSQLPLLGDQVTVDRAHLAMLVEADILPAADAARLLDELARLLDGGFAELRGRTTPRGAYLVYEQHLVDRTGPDAGGMLQLGRSRNDVQATIFLLRLRRSFSGVARALLDLSTSLVARAREHARLPMPAYTHGQPAVPITFGHYLAGVAAALSRDADGLFDAARSFERCPLGAGAVGGTTVPIRPERTAELLGFAGPLVNSVDGVASRDAALRVLAAAAITGTTTSRLAGDLLAWLGDTAFLELPDSLVGSSSMMPQKRNPYFLEHVQGRAARPLGAFVAACTAMHGKPFTNHIAVGTEGVAEVERALEDHCGALVLLRSIVAGMTPRPERMAARSADAFVEATEIATVLAKDATLGFRGAHALVGRAVGRALDGGLPLVDAVDAELAALGRPALSGSFRHEDIAARCIHAGGPGTAPLEDGIRALEQHLPELQERLDAMEARWTAASRALSERVQQIRASGASRRNG